MENAPKTNPVKGKTEDNNSASVGVQQKKESSERVLRALRNVEEALEGLSNKETLKVLKMVGAIYNVHPASNFAPLTQQGKVAAPLPIRQLRGVGSGPRPKAENKDPTVVRLKGELQQLQGEIREAKEHFAGGVLPKDHALIQQRDFLLAQIAQAKGSFRPQSGTKESPKDDVSSSKKETKS